MHKTVLKLYYNILKGNFKNKNYLLISCINTFLNHINLIFFFYIKSTSSRLFLQILYILRFTWTKQSTDWVEEHWSTACTPPSTTQQRNVSPDSDPSPPTSRVSRSLCRSLLPLMGRSLQRGSKSLQYTLTLQIHVY